LPARPDPPSRRLATIDLGTNTVRLLVAEVEGGTWRAVEQAQRVTRLGEGQAGSSRLQEAPIARTLAVVTEYAALAERLYASPVRIVATSAVREAVNRDQFGAQIQAATGYPLEVISGVDEARLAMLGIATGLPELGGSFLSMDIGGGSTEFVLARSGRPVHAVSLTLGVVALTEAFLDAGPVDRQRYRAMAAAVEAQLGREVPCAIVAARAPALVGTAGTVTTLAALDLGLEAYRAERVQGHRLTRVAVEAQRERLGAMSVAERAQVACVEPGRADVLIAGIAICLAAMELLGFSALIVSDAGLREGLLQEILAR
jgi:exopolyphosphatase / guanosine-5'-triphosphate,3'-diphosphate pyrophosphatase